MLPSRATDLTERPTDGVDGTDHETNVFGDRDIIAGSVTRHGVAEIHLKEGNTAVVAL